MRPPTPNVKYVWFSAVLCPKKEHHMTYRESEMRALEFVTVVYG